MALMSCHQNIKNSFKLLSGISKVSAACFEDCQILVSVFAHMSLEYRHMYLLYVEEGKTRTSDHCQPILIVRCNDAGLYVQGFLLQSLAAKMGVSTGKHLAQHCRWTLSLTAMKRNFVFGERLWRAKLLLVGWQCSTWNWHLKVLWFFDSHVAWLRFQQTELNARKQRVLVQGSVPWLGNLCHRWRKDRWLMETHTLK